MTTEQLDYYQRLIDSQDFAKGTIYPLPLEQFSDLITAAKQLEKVRALKLGNRIGSDRIEIELHVSYDVWLGCNTLGQALDALDKEKERK